MAKKVKRYEPKLAVKDGVQFDDFIALSLRTPPDKAEPPKKKAKKKGAK